VGDMQPVLSVLSDTFRCPPSPEGVHVVLPVSVNPPVPPVQGPPLVVDIYPEFMKAIEDEIPATVGNGSF
jgi:hypothetical protein